MTIPRIAIGTIQPGADVTPAVWSLLAVLSEDGFQIQRFHYRSDSQPCERVRQLTGQGQRHLDSWLMSRELCRELFVLGCQGNDLAVIDGRFDVAYRPELAAAAVDWDALLTPAGTRSARTGAALPSSVDFQQSVSGHRASRRVSGASGVRSPRETEMLGGSLDVLCQWLDLPRIVVVDAARWSRGEMVDPPFRVSGIILDQVSDMSQGVSLAATLRHRWGAPVLGVLPPQHEPSGEQEAWGGGCRETSRQTFRQCSMEFRNSFRAGSFWRLAEREDHSAWEVPSPLPSLGEGRRLRIAVACDDAFPCSFPDTLDLLEACGAELRAFSPLRSPELPAGADMVYLGCGQLERYADELSANCCLKQSLHAFAMGGGRIYAEGAGLAYLCRQLVTRHGQRVPMANVLPALASRRCGAAYAEPAVVRFRRPTWLGKAYQELRGYLQPQWRIDAWGTTTNLALEPEHQGDLLGYRNVIGSRLHLNFAAQPHYLSAFFRPRTAAYAPV